jgi:hypothetical protein
VIEKTADYGLTGGIIFDAIISAVAEKMNADKLFTFTTRDYERLLPGRKVIVSPP